MQSGVLESFDVQASVAQVNENYRKLKVEAASAARALVAPPLPPRKPFAHQAQRPPPPSSSALPPPPPPVSTPLPSGALEICLKLLILVHLYRFCIVFSSAWQTAARLPVRRRRWYRRPQTSPARLCLRKRPLRLAAMTWRQYRRAPLLSLVSHLIIYRALTPGRRHRRHCRRSQPLHGQCYNNNTHLIRLAPIRPLLQPCA